MKNNTLHWPSAVQFALSILGIIGCWGMAGLAILVGLMQMLGRSSIEGGGTSMFLLASGGVLGGVLVIPSAGYALGRLLDRPVIRPGWFQGHPRLALVPTGLMFLLPLIWFLGDRVSRMERLSWLLLPPLHILAVGIPILWFIYMGRRKLLTGSPQRAWGVFTSGLILGPSIILVLEMAALVVMMFVLMIYMFSQPGLMQKLTSLFDPFGPSPDPQLIQCTLQPYLMRPGFIFALFVYIAGIVPLIEEVFKPIGIWFLVGRDLSPAEGFTAGLISGTGYALFENLLLTSMGGDWAVTLIARIGTSLLHITTASLIGWALAVAWRKGRYWLLGLMYFVAVLLHSIWNAVALFTSAVSLPFANPSQEPLLQTVSTGAYVLLGILTVLLFFILIGLNYALRSASEPVIRSENAVNPLPDRSDPAPG